MIGLGGWPVDGLTDEWIIGPYRSQAEAMARATLQLEIVKAKRDREAEMIRALRVDAKVSETRAGREL